MPRFRFTVRRMMILVAVVGVVLGLIIASVRLTKLPTNSIEALEYVERWSSHARIAYDDIEVRKLRPGEQVDAQFGGTFEVRYIRKNSQGVMIECQSILVMVDGYCLKKKALTVTPGTK